MLVLSRKQQEAIIIDDRIRVTVLSVQGNRVKLGVTGPANVPIHREELYVEIASLGQTAVADALPCSVAG